MSVYDTNSRSASPGPSNSALLIIDMISDFDFEDGDKLYRQASAIANNIADLKKRARKAKVPVIYLNDNYGRWNEDFASFVENIRENSPKGREIIDVLEPQDDDLFILKPQRSGFYGTSLGVLLLSMEASKIILTGVTTDICILFTAHDAYMRGYHVQIPEDCSGAVDPGHHEQAIKFLKRVADADVKSGENIEFGTGPSKVADHNTLKPPSLHQWIYAGA